MRVDISKVLVYIYILLLAITPAIFLGEGNRNLLLIGAMGISPIVFLFKPGLIPKVDLPLLSICFMMIFFPAIFHYETIRWSTVLYSCMFCLFFMSFVRVLMFSSFTLDNFQQLLRGLLYAYCVVLIIQQVCVLFGLPIFNVSNYSILDPWKLNSLSPEPSHSARMIAVIMCIYLTIQIEINKEYTLSQSWKESKKPWFAFLYSAITMGSGTALFLMFLTITRLISLKRLSSFILVALVMVVLLFAFSENKTMERVRKTFIATLSLNEQEIIEADHSASFRIVPNIQGAKAVKIRSLDDFVGHGVDADTRLIEPLPSVEKGNAGGFTMWINYGVIAQLIWWFFTLSICFGSIRHVLSLFIWFFCIFSYGGLNSQIVWFTLVVFWVYGQLKTQRLGALSNL